MIAPSLKGRNCLITGASGALGGALARTFWNHGANLFLTGRNTSRLQALHDELSSSDAKEKTLGVFACELRGTGEVDRLLEKAIEHMGQITVLINNAGIQGPIGPLWKNDWSAWTHTVEVDLFVPVLLCARVIPEMIRGGYGKIINLSGGGATGPRPNFSAYAASKTALVRMTEILAHETKGGGIDVNAIAPGPMNTRMLDEVLAAGVEAVGEREYESCLRRAKEGGTPPEKAADLAVFLASAESDGISGRLISAVWDPWAILTRHEADLGNSDIFTLRRIVPSDRGLDWGMK